MKVAVLMGGRSSEREISLRSGQGMAQALRNLGHDVTSVDAADGSTLPAGKEEAAAPKRDAVLKLAALGDAPAVQVAGRAAMPTWCSSRSTARTGRTASSRRRWSWPARPTPGSGVLASAIAMDKAMSKRVFEREAIPTPHWMLLDPATGPQHRRSLARRLPARGEAQRRGLDGGAHDREPRRRISTRRSRTRAQYDNQILVEQYIDGPRADRRGGGRGGLPDRGDQAEERFLRLRVEVHDGQDASTSARPMLEEEMAATSASWRVRVRRGARLSRGVARGLPAPDEDEP